MNTSHHSRSCGCHTCRAVRRSARAIHASNVRYDRAEHGEHVTLRGDTVERDAALVERITLAESDPWSAGQ